MNLPKIWHERLLTPLLLENSLFLSELSNWSFLFNLDKWLFLKNSRCIVLVWMPFLLVIIHPFNWCLCHTQMNFSQLTYIRWSNIKSYMNPLSRESFQLQLLIYQTLISSNSTGNVQYVNPCTLSKNLSELFSL